MPKCSTVSTQAHKGWQKQHTLEYRICTQNKDSPLFLTRYPSVNTQNYHAGLRYLPAAARNTTRVHGSVFYGDAPPRYQVGSLDLRGLTLWGSQLYVTSSFTAEPNRNMDDLPGYTPWGGVVRIAGHGVLPRSSTGDATLAKGFSGRRNFWTFQFETSKSLWALADMARYTRVPQSQQLAAERDFDSRFALSGPASLAAAADSSFSARPLFYRSNVVTAVVNWRWSADRIAWVEESVGAKAYINDACYSMVGRQEARPGAHPSVPKQWAVYTTGRAALYRVDPTTNAVTVVARAPAGQLFR